MTTQEYDNFQTVAGGLRLRIGATLVALAGIGLVVYGVAFLIRNFTGYVEIGLTSEHLGGTPEQIRSFSPQLFEYVAHLNVAVSGFIMALGIAVTALGWYGIRQGERWALWTALLAPVIALVVALPLHYPYGIGTLGHLGPIYLDALILLVGAAIAYTAMPERNASAG
ncbi:MAG: hypothetical protein M3426_16620 [Actinomycetota bacterium]|nr:hypothetical protein [Actinomycetota bacterium]